MKIIAFEALRIVTLWLAEPPRGCNLFQQYNCRLRAVRLIYRLALTSKTAYKEFTQDTLLWFQHSRHTTLPDSRIHNRRTFYASAQRYRHTLMEDLTTTPCTMSQANPTKPWAPVTWPLYGEEEHQRWALAWRNSVARFVWSDPSAPTPTTRLSCHLRAHFPSLHKEEPTADPTQLPIEVLTHIVDFFCGSLFASLRAPPSHSFSQKTRTFQPNFVSPPEDDKDPLVKEWHAFLSHLSSLPDRDPLLWSGRYFADILSPVPLEPYDSHGSPWLESLSLYDWRRMRPTYNCYIIAHVVRPLLMLSSVHTTFRDVVVAKDIWGSILPFIPHRSPTPARQKMGFTPFERADLAIRRLLRVRPYTLRRLGKIAASKPPKGGMSYHGEVCAAYLWKNGGAPADIPHLPTKEFEGVRSFFASMGGAPACFLRFRHHNNPCPPKQLTRVRTTIRVYYVDITPANRELCLIHAAHRWFSHRLALRDENKACRKVLRLPKFIHFRPQAKRKRPHKPPKSPKSASPPKKPRTSL